MHLHALLDDAAVLELTGDSHVDVSDITHDSRRVTSGALFCCIRGRAYDGHDHAAAAADAGAVTLLVDRTLPVPVTQVRVERVRAAIGPIAARFYDEPSRAMRVLGITGTNGKTTTTYLLEAIARADGERAGVIGTTGARVAGVDEPLAFTTPEATELQRMLARMRDDGVTTVAMEVSSHALAYERVDGTRFAAVGFTNLSQDHLDEHGTLEEYFEAKARLFSTTFTGSAAVTLDDPWGSTLADRAVRAGLDVWTFGRDPRAGVRATNVELDAEGSTLRLETPAGPAVTVRLSLVGAFNVQNALAAAATALAGGFTLDAVSTGLQADLIVPGRMERVVAGQPFTVLVDYAHTPAALDRLLDESRRLAGGSRVIVVFGCGGDRDATKRIEMGRAAAAADLVLLTSDNPRSEDPAAIAAAAEAGLREREATYEVELDRRRAIRRALGDARATDVVVIAGKGHERGQDIAGVTTPFDDRVVAREELEAVRVDLTRDEIVEISGGRAQNGDGRGGPAVARGFAFDSRTLVAGAGFVALRDIRDGHDFVADAFARGAGLALVERVPEGVGGPLVVVPDSRVALQALAVAARARLATAAVIGVTGSAGKTSTKDLTAAALRPGFAVHASEASFNNEIGLPVTLLGAPDDTGALVLEMGARFAGNIRELCVIAQPAIGVITNIGLAHAEHLGGPEGIAAVKGELLDALPTNGLAVLNADNEHLASLRSRSAAPVITVGSDTTADVRISEVRLDPELRATFRLDSPWGTVEAVRLAVRGAYQVANAGQAATVALHLGVPLDAVVAGLGGAVTAAWRMELTSAPEGFVVLNDAYNASPTSMRAALESFAQLPVRGRRIAVLGEMRELGAVAVREHAALGDLVADADVVALVVVADRDDPVMAGLAATASARGVEVHDVADPDAAVGIVRKLAGPDDAVLIKASRAVGLERVAQSLTESGSMTSPGGDAR